MAQIYETAEDLRKERQTMDDVIHQFPGLTPIKLYQFCEVDFALVDNHRTVDQFVEVKNRKNKIGQYPTLTISLQKISDAVNLTRFLTKPLVLVIGWTDCIGTVKITKSLLKSCPVVFNGRTDRPEDPKALEPQLAIKTSEFKIFTKNLGETFLPSREAAKPLSHSAL